MRKKVLMLFLVLLLMVSFSAAAFADENITLKINDMVVAPVAAPVQENGSTLVPVRVIAENLGAEVEYQEESRRVTITKNDKIIVLMLNETAVTVNGESQNLLTPPKTINGTTMVPIRFISENLDCAVNWDSETKTVAINSLVQAADEFAVSNESEEQPASIQNTASADVSNSQSEANITPAVSVNSSKAASADTVVYQTKTGDKYHSDGCRSLRRSKIATTVGQAVQNGLTPCSICNPPVMQ